jgi:homoserine kinase
MHRKATVRAPATTANLGPGFDCLGMALEIWNRISIEMGGGPRVVVQGEGASELPADEGNLVYRAAALLFREAGLDAPSLSIHCTNDIPLKRGLGSSAAAIVGGLLAANLLLDQPLPVERLLELATSMEGHPDNVAPALLGGCRVVVREGERLIAAPVPIPEDVWAVLFIPDVAIPTDEARAVLPTSVSLEDAVYNMGRVALLVNALSTGRLEDLKVATQDRLHQPARQRLFPQMKVILRAALEAGALGAFLSGSGSTVLALTRGREMTVGYEMAEAAMKACLSGTVRITRPAPQGAHPVEAGEV